MLESIVINNFTIIDRTHIDFETGMTALTGETGAGKSILLDAIKLVLGDRADTDTVKSGCDRADIAVSFDIRDLEAVRGWLAVQDLGQDDECLLRRVIQASGRSKAYINGSPAALSQLRELGEMLVDIHGQHEHQSLQKPAIQRQLLDATVNEPELFARLGEQFHDWKQLVERQQNALDQSAQKQQRIDLLKQYTRELHELALKPDEVHQLQDEHNRLAHAGQIIETTSALLTRLYDDDEQNIQALLAQSTQQLEQLALIDSSLGGARDLLQNALIHIQEASSELRAYHDAIDLDPGRLDWLNTRLSQAQNLARKHQVDADQLVALGEQFDAELEQLEFSEQDLQALEMQLAEARNAYLQTARELSARRREAAERLSTEISDVMHTLGMQGGRFAVALHSNEEESAFSTQGIDRIEFLVSANPGQPPKPLAKVASGGELSRISLAIQVILSESSHIPTLIFDEVYSGIGGGIAEIIGRRLRQIAAHRQVFCVTHLPQVASQAHHHYQVSKTKTDASTSTDVMPLDDQQRLEEIARMLGGMTITEQTRAHAREMLDNMA